MIADGEKGKVFYLLFVFMSLSTIGKVLRILAKLLGDLISIVYHYGEYTEVKNADPDRYSYVDVIYDTYCSVLKDIPSGKTIKFSIKAVLPNGDESVLKEDKDVVRMFEKSTDACDPIHYYVFGLEVNEEVSNVYWVNTFEGNVMQRPNTSVVSSPSRQRTPIKRHEQKTHANRSKSGGGGSKAIGKSIAGSREVHNLSSSSEAESLDNDDVDWQQHGEGSDNQNHSESEGCQSDGEDDEVSDGGQSCHTPILHYSEWCDEPSINQRFNQDLKIGYPTYDKPKHIPH
ncbi:hypothetical protein NE237_012570 [Protea cynaroides]|uniref:Uncharacterized protein n=1 Tax=Protea cynaroides TaxID=273540 RepID=A0A9Q0JY47_9MAGN|nr:hypothetical protein NE237_012570 [Protea cynaroides]